MARLDDYDPNSNRGLPFHFDSLLKDKAWALGQAEAKDSSLYPRDRRHVRDVLDEMTGKEIREANEVIANEIDRLRTQAVLLGNLQSHIREITKV